VGEICFEAAYFSLLFMSFSLFSYAMRVFLAFSALESAFSNEEFLTANCLTSSFCWVRVCSFSMFTCSICSMYCSAYNSLFLKKFASYSGSWGFTVVFDCFYFSKAEERALI
jgi:hypothetical protein